MRKSRFTEEQIVGILQEYAAGAKVSELCRKHGMSDATLYKWKAKYGGMTVSELRRLKDLEAENSELKRLLADAMLDNAGLKGLPGKKLITVRHESRHRSEAHGGPARREAVRTLVTEHQFTQRRACRLVGISRSSLSYQARPDRHTRLRERLITLSGKHRRYGYRMLHAKLVREGFRVNVKAVERIYREERLWLRRTKRKKIPKEGREGGWCPIAANQRWSLDFTCDALANGRKFRTANIKDDCTRECPAIEADFSLPGERVVEMLQRVAQERGYPDILVVDNGPELRGRALDAWADDHGVQLYFIDPGKPTQNAYIESFNGRFRDECLNQHWFTSIGEAREIIEEWRIDYNTERPHSSLKYQTPGRVRSSAALP
ncbi:MAG: IS3 family transposase [Pseudomonadota bacterium]